MARVVGHLSVSELQAECWSSEDATQARQFQPPYAPELNPVENVWQFLRASWLAISVFDGYDDIVDACCAAWNRFADDPATVISTTARLWAQVSE